MLAKNFPQQYFASCPLGLEHYLQDELISMGIQQMQLQRGGVEFDCPSLSLLLSILFHTRIASRIFLKLDAFPIRRVKDIYNHALKIPWATYFNHHMSFKVQCLMDREIMQEAAAEADHPLANSLYISRLLKDAIVDQFRNAVGDRPNVELSAPDVRILLYLTYESPQKNSSPQSPAECWWGNLYFDLCGDPLSQRHYRGHNFEAPLRENLAAGILKIIQWQERPLPLIDPMCGSGTFLIEAAWMKGNIPPSVLRVRKSLEFPQEKYWIIENLDIFTKSPHWQSQWQKALHSVEQETQQGLAYLKELKSTSSSSAAAVTEPQLPLLGFDLDPQAIRISRQNINRALMDPFIKIAASDARSLHLPQLTKGIILCNPPYGERLGTTCDLGKLYEDYGENLKKNFKNFEAYILTGNLELRKRIQLRTEKRIPLMNSNIECRLLKYNLF